MTVCNATVGTQKEDTHRIVFVPGFEVTEISPLRESTHQRQIPNIRPRNQQDQPTPRLLWNRPFAAQRENTRQCRELAKP